MPPMPWGDASRRRFASLVLCVLSLVFLPGTAAAAPIQIGILVDGSGSIGSSNFASMRTGIANAVATLPTNGTVEFALVRFASGSTTIVNATLINSPATLTAIVGAINGMTFPGGGTDMAAGITQMTGLFNMTNAQRTAFNIVTDGFPTNAQTAINARNAAIAAGLDEFDAEFIGTVGSSGFNFLLNDLVYDGVNPLNNGHLAPPFTPGFVVPVGNFGQAFEDAFTAKLRFLVSQAVPEPASLALFGAAAMTAGYLGWRRRKPAAA